MELKQEARKAGVLLEPRWGGAPDVPDETLKALVELIGEAPAADAGKGEPRRAYVPPFLSKERVFGIALQLYQLRSARNLGIGDLADLDALLAMLCEVGADFVGLNPLHALFTAAPDRASPFAPSERKFLNPLIIAVDRVPGYAPAMREAVAVPSTEDEVDYPAATRAKLDVLRAIHRLWREGHGAVPQSELAEARRNRSEGGAALERFALFEALSHHMVGEGRAAGWRDWPKEFHDPASPAVRSFAESQRAAIDFHAFLQFLAERQLADVHRNALGKGMRIGLYMDLAVGVAPDGAATWSDPDAVMRGVTLGAPPDLFSNEGQEWGLAPFSPAALIAADFRPYKEMLSAVMRSAGAIRIDHVMGLERLFLIPEGASALDGAYVAMPGLTEALVAATHEHAAIAIGEDLGVVPEGFRDRMAERAIFSTRIAVWERNAAGMRPPARYPPLSLACLSTHDIAPLQAWWDGDDIAIRERLGHLSPQDVRQAEADRASEKRALLLLAGLPPSRGDRAMADDVRLAFHRIIARSASRLAVVRLEDVVGGDRLVNLPGTDREHPNWRKTLPLTVEQLASSDILAHVFRVMSEERR